MTQYVDVAPRVGSPERKREVLPTTVWLLIVAAVIIAVSGVVCDASLTPDQRNQAYLQSGMFP